MIIDKYLRYWLKFAVIGPSLSEAICFIHSLEQMIKSTLNIKKKKMKLMYLKKERKLSGLQLLAMTNVRD